MKNSACCVLGHILGRLLTAAVLGAASLPVAAGEVQVAVASNFAAPMQRLAADFARASGHTAVLAFGASGSLYAQVRHGAPFELLLSADEAVPARLQAVGLAVTGSRFT